MLREKHKPWVAYVLAALGILVMLAELALHFISYFTKVDYEINRAVLIVGAIIGFVGFYLINSKAAEGSTGVVTKTAVAILGVIRGGRRATDNYVAAPVPINDPSIQQHKNDPEIGGA